MHREKQLFWVILWIGLAYSSSAQSIIPLDTTSSKIHITHYETDDGLLQNTVRDLAFDNLGFLWIVSEKGASRYDGRSFVHYNDADFVLNVRTKSRQLEILDSGLYLNGSPQYEILDGKLAVKPEAKFLSELEFGIGRQILNISNNTILRERLKAKPPSYLGNYQIYFFKVNDSTIYWPNSKYELDYIVNGKVEKKLSLVNLSQNNDSKRLDYNRFFLLDSSLFFLSDNNTLFQYEKGELYLTHRFDQKFDRFHIYWNSSGAVYLINKSKVYELFKRNDSLSLKLLFKVPEGDIKVVLPLKDENGWFVGTGRSGMYKLVIQDFKSLHVDELGVRNNIRSIYEVGEDSLLTTSAILYTKKGGADLRVRDVKLSFKDSLSFMNFQRISKTPNFVDKLPSYVHPFLGDFSGKGNFIQDSTGAFWHAKGVRISRVSPPSKTYKDDTHIGYRGSFYNPFKNEIWTTYKGGVRVFSIANGNYRWIPEFNNKHVRNVVFLRANLAWISIVGKGLHSWDGKELIAYPLDFKEALRYCHTVVEDDNGFLWISTDNGLFKVSMEELTHFKDHREKPVYYYRFDKKNGFLTNEFNGSGFPCGLKLSNGKIAFPSLLGAVLFDPDEVKIPSFKYGLTLDKITLNGKDTVIDLENGLAQNFDQLDFHLGYSYFGELHNLLLEYRVEGLHEKWQPVPVGNVIRLGQLNYGEYKLVVRRKNGFGIDNFSYLNYPFKINPRFYETSSFKVLIVFLLLFVIAGLLLLNSFLAKLKRIKLEKIIHEKTEEQLVLNDELKLNLAKVQQSEMELRDNTEMKDKFMAIYTHDVRGPLRFVKTITSVSIKRINDIDQEEIVERLEDIETATHQVYLLTEHMFHWLRSKKDDFALRTESFSLNGLIDKVLQQYKKQAKNKSIELKQLPFENSVVQSEKNVLTIVLSNIVDNAIKFTMDGEITILVKELTDYVMICVKDTGVGISKEKLSEIKRGIYTSEEGTAGEKGTGFGLKAIGELLLMINAYMEIESEEYGTSVSIYLKRP